MRAEIERVAARTASPDRELWRMRGPKGTIIAATLREVRAAAGTWDAWIRYELRILHEGQVYLTEQYTDPAGRDRRLDELHAMLEAKGWTPAP